MNFFLFIDNEEENFKQKKSHNSKQTIYLEVFVPVLIFLCRCCKYYPDEFFFLKFIVKFHTLSINPNRLLLIYQTHIIFHLFFFAHLSNQLSSSLFVFVFFIRYSLLNIHFHF